MKQLISTEVAISSIVPATWNRDIGDRKLLALVVQIEAAGQILSPLHVWLRDDGKHDLWCGHRRLAAANRLGHKTVPCIVHDRRQLKKGETVEALRERIVRAEGESAQAIHADQLAIYVRSDKGIRPSSAAVSRHIALTEEMLGPDGPRLLLETGSSIRTCAGAQSARRWMASKGKGATNIALVPSESEIARWMIQHKGAASRNALDKLGWPSRATDLFRSRIRANAPVTPEELAGAL